MLYSNIFISNRKLFFLIAVPNICVWTSPFMNIIECRKAITLLKELIMNNIYEEIMQINPLTTVAISNYG